ncbi:VPA1262 family protein [Fictibacillus phosphorivorans]|uniref:VPA1262 family protein n=1 Tax=Fictibacillus phosphorivorans TaxID=1221500 RepID=UPI00203FE483|nr:VPA1262 family protein [Fictibacillus phosphorivorans]MCM3718099.1 VPA1262 family protein [Fictibacillus phosphorivorans]MCM3775726.1 VPA1262 family protein [Fictibacillus phosphorivorans]
MTDINQLFCNFDQLRLDKKLENVMRKEVNCQLQMWVLEICGEKAISQRLLYSWIIPSDYCDGKWYKTDVETKWSPDSSAYKVNIKKITFFSDGESIALLMLDLLKGSSLLEACVNLNLTQPPKELTKFGIGAPSKNTYVVRPPVFLETESTNRLYKEYIRPIQSPSRNVSCVSASLFQLHKLNIWGEDDISSKPIDYADELAKFCINALKKETGLNFESTDSSRLGNIEWIATPLLDPEALPIDFSTVRENIANSSINIKTISCREVEVYLQPELNLPSNKLLIRCRLRNHHEIILDQIKQVDANDAEQGLRFRADQEVSRIQLTVWIANSEDDEWDIWFEQDTPIMREMSMAIGMVGLQGTVGLSTIQEWKNSKKIKDRVHQYEKIKQTNYQHSSTAGYVHDPWTPSSIEINNYVKRLFPTKSKGRFFPKGWGDDGPSVLSFAEWFKSITNNTDRVKVTIVDPYFDTVGLELIAHSPTTNNSFEVITCTQLKSHDDNLAINTDAQTNDSEPERATRIKKGCENLRLFLSRLQLKVLDIRGNQRGKSSYFHDRYLLIYDSSGNVSEGYHLSNSLQAATKFDPLLVTPIPTDILIEVASYVNVLRNAQPPIINHASAVQIYPKKVVNNADSGQSVIKSKDDELIKRLSKTSLFFAELLQDSDIASADFESIKQKLLEHKLLDPNSFQFVVVKEEFIVKTLCAFSEKLVCKGDGEFSLLWESFSFWLANIVDYEKYLFKVSDYQGIKLGEKIMSYLLNPSDVLIEGFNEAQEITVHQKNNFLNNNFKESLYDAYLSLDGYYDNRLYGHYHLQYSTKAMIYILPSLIVNTLEKLNEREKFNKQSVFVIRAYLLDELFIHLLFNSSFDLINALLASNISSLRGLGSQARWFHLSEIEDLSKPSDLDLPELNNTERIFAFSEWIYHLRVKANRMGSESQEIKDIRKKLYIKIHKWWPDNFHPIDKDAILRRLSGPSVGGWSKDIYHELLLCLVQDKKITSDEAILFWLNLLLEKIEGGKGNNISFYAPTDILLTDLCASISPELSEEAWGVKVRQVQKLINKCNREIRRPFEKSINFNNWNKVKKQGLWVKAFLELAYNATHEKKQDILELLNQMDDKLKNTSNCTDRYLSEFANQTSH